MKNFFFYIFLAMLVIVISVASFMTYRWFNYSFGYESMVKETIRQMVKEEALK
jgi:hypothetical protein